MREREPSHRSHPYSQESRGHRARDFSGAHSRPQSSQDSQPRRGGKRGDPPSLSHAYGATRTEETEPQEGSGQEPVEKPNFGVSGALARDSNVKEGVVLKYSEPPEARRPRLRYRLYVFKAGEQIDVLHIHRQSVYLIGRDRLVVDIPVDHTSCSKQHAVIQYRQVARSDDELGLETHKVVV